MLRSAILLSAFFFVSPLFAFDHTHAPWTALLKKHAIAKGSATKVDYSGFKADGDALDAYLKSLSDVTRAEYDGFSREQKMAFLINAYNAFTVKIVTDHYPVKSIKDIGSLFRNTWKIKFFKLLGEEMNLDAIEHEYLRKIFKEPRVHFAVNCASIGCPALRTEAYTSDKLNSQLTDQAKLFLRDRSRNKIEGKKVALSMIFKWFHEDFEGAAKTVQNFLADFMTDDSAEKAKLKAGVYEVDYLTYDWNLNGA